MKRNTIKWRILKYYIFAIVSLITITALIFNIAIKVYIEKDTFEQLERIAARIEDTALRRGPDFLSESKRILTPPSFNNEEDKFIRYNFILDHSLREPFSVLNADFILLDKEINIINLKTKDMPSPSEALLSKITEEITKSKNLSEDTYLDFSIAGTQYIAIIKPVYDKNSFGLGWIGIYSSLNKLNELKMAINIILLIILLLSALIIAFLSSILSKKISAPFSSLNQHIRAIAERNFDAKLQMPVDDELQELVNNINTMTDKLESYDKAQKTFLQNASHEFRTPIMSIQSYAEGIKYEVVDKKTAVEVIIDESKRLTSLVEDLLYLSRLDSLEENYRFSNLNFNEFMLGCIERMNGIALKSNVKLILNSVDEPISIFADDDKLSRAINNIISNCLRYAKTLVKIDIKVAEENVIILDISDDGNGFDPNELPNIFERFYKGKKGNFGLGLAISKNIIEKHNGHISAGNSSLGAIFTIELPIIQVTGDR